MSYILQEQFNSAFVGPPMTPKGFAIHWWGDPNQHPTFDAIVNVLLQRGREQSASVHFIAEAARVACLVSPTNAAWGQGDGGNGWGNLNLVSIECNPRCTAADRETVAELMADQHLINGVPLVAYPHNKFTATQCPGVWEQHIPWLISRAKQLVAAKQGKTAPVKKQENTVAEANEHEKTRDYIGQLLVSGYATGRGTARKNVPGIAEQLDDINDQLVAIKAALAKVAK